MTFYNDLYAGVPGYKGKTTHANLMHTIIIIIMMIIIIMLIVILIQILIKTIIKV